MMLDEPQTAELAGSLRDETLQSEMTIPAWRRIWNKLWSMDRREFAGRSRQELAKRTDALLAHFGYNFTGDAFAANTPAEARFFFRSEDLPSLCEALQQRLPGQAGQIVAKADRICAHRFDLLGFEDLYYGDPIDWHLDAVHSRRAPLRPFHRIDYLNFAEVGDAKITWELNRHQHLVTLAKASLLTGDRRYVVEILAQWRDWHRANPYPRGINWASSLEVAFRSLSWMWVHYLLASSDFLGPEFRQDWLRAQALNGRHLERYLSTYFSPNTHLLGEAVALFFLGTLCPQFSRAERWKNLGWQIVLDEARRQVNADGLHFEQSTYYHVYALDFFLHAILLASANGVGVPREIEATLENMCDALLKLGSAGPPPSIGDDDGGRVFDPARNRSHHLLDPLATGAILFSRGDFKALAGDLREEPIWLLGIAGIEQWDRIEAQAVAPRSTGFRSAGLYVLATPNAELAIKGGSAHPQSRGHDHADALSVCLQSDGRALLIDSGTCEYVGPGPERNRFRGTAMHNTLSVDSADQAAPEGPFSWKTQFTTRTEQWIPGETFDLFAGMHDGYTRLPSPVVHRRWVVALNSGLILVRDVAEGAGVHQLDIQWHLAPDLHVEGEHLFRFKNSSHGLAILPVQGHGWAESVQKGVCSPAYGCQSPATVVTFGTFARLPAEFVTVLVPLADARTLPGTLEQVQNDLSSRVRAYRYNFAEGECRFFFAPSGEPWKLEPVSSDAEFVCLVSRPSGDFREIIFCHGSYVRIAGAQTLRAKANVRRAESILGPGSSRPKLVSDPESPIELTPPESSAQ